jgi:hypothetical protein
MFSIAGPARRRLGSNAAMSDRPLLACPYCNYTWHPRGRDYSVRCPNCGKRLGNEHVVGLIAGGVLVCVLGGCFALGAVRSLLAPERQQGEAQVSSTEGPGAERAGPRTATPPTGAAERRRPSPTPALARAGDDARDEADAARRIAERPSDESVRAAENRRQELATARATEERWLANEAKAGAEAEKALKKEGLAEAERQFVADHVTKGRARGDLVAAGTRPLNLGGELRDGNLGAPQFRLPGGGFATSRTLTVEEVISADEMVVKGGPLVWVKGLSTAKLEAGSMVELKGAFVVAGTRPYTTRAGTKRALPCLVAFDVEKVNAILDSEAVKNWLSARASLQRAKAEVKAVEDRHWRQAQAEARALAEPAEGTPGVGANAGMVYVRGHYQGGKWVAGYYRSAPGRGSRGGGRR